MSPLPTVADMVGASVGAFNLEMNAPAVRPKPRASGIGDCARKQSYSMRNVGTTNPGQRDGALTTEQGRIMEDMSVEVLRQATGGELVVANRQIELPEGFGMTGHPDGQVVRRDVASWSFDCRVCGGDPTVRLCSPLTTGHEYRPVGWVAALDSKIDGQVVGFEHKHLGRYGFNKIAKEGFIQAEPSYYAQTLSYGAALGWDKVLVVVLAQDSSATQAEATTNLKAAKPKVRWAANPDYHPKLNMIELDLTATTNTQKRLNMRAAWLTDTLFEKQRDPSDVMREADPLTWDKENPVARIDGSIEIEMGPQFPCSHCPWLQRCIDDGEGTLQAPQWK